MESVIPLFFMGCLIALSCILSKKMTGRIVDEVRSGIIYKKRKIFVHNIKAVINKKNIVIRGIRKQRIII